jgi:hypothetical protein
MDYDELFSLRSLFSVGPFTDEGTGPHELTIYKHNIAILLTSVPGDGSRESLGNNGS